MAVIELFEASSSSGRAQDLEYAMHGVIQLIAAQPGAGRCEALRGVEDPSAFVFAIEWESLDAHAAFRGSAAFSRYESLVEGLIGPDTRMAHYRLVASVAR